MAWLIALILGLVAADPPLTVKAIAGPPAQVELRNTGTQPINAWAFAISAPNAQGGIRRTFHSADVYMSEVTIEMQRAAPHLKVLKPGESRAVPVDPFPPNASVQVIAVVLDDNTAFGDEQTIAGIFQNRAVERDQLKQVVDVFTESLKSLQGTAALQEMERRFAASASADESVVHRSARQAVDAWLKQAATAGNLVEDSVRTYVAFVSQQYLTAAMHSPRAR